MIPIAAAVLLGLVAAGAQAQGTGLSLFDAHLRYNGEAPVPVPNRVGELSHRCEVTSGRRFAPAWRAQLLRFPARSVVGSNPWVDGRRTQSAQIGGGP